MTAVQAWLFPGQGSQRIGMGDRFGDSPLWSRAEAVLGYSVREQCLHGAEPGLSDTGHVQPALFTVNAVMWEHARIDGARPDFLAGHSLGEYNALLAAGCLDFETGLRLVRMRGRLMSEAGGGAMTAVVDADVEAVSACLAAAGVRAVEVANHNTARQVVVSGTEEGIEAAERALRSCGLGRAVRLRVSAAFHSWLMAPAAEKFAAELERIDFAEPRIPVIANVTARPYEPGRVRELLGRQMRAPVLWWQSMSRLLREGVTEIRELGPGSVLTGLWAEASERPHTPRPEPRAAAPEVGADRSESELGSASFRRDYGLRHAYLSGSMFQGIASPELVAAMAKAGLFGFFGSGGLPPSEVEKAIDRLEGELGVAGRFGVNLLASPGRPDREDELVDLLLRRGVRHAEASGYTTPTESVVRYRFADAALSGPRRLIAKLSRPEVARAFASPPSERLLRRLVERGGLSRADAATAARLPVAEDLCVEADSGGHTDGGNLCVLLPAMIRLCEEQARRHGYERAPRVGAAGGLGTPEAVAAAFLLGADFVVTGSINQCTPQADTSVAVKALLATLEVHDTAYAPAGDMFEYGARVQVVRKGTLFASRGNKLYELYRRFGGIEELDSRTRAMIEERCFRRPLDEVAREVEHRLRLGGDRAIERFRGDPKHRMALIFKRYFSWTNRLARDGDPEMRADYQIHCGPAMGALNGYLAGGAMAGPERRDAARLGLMLMRDAADVIGAERGRP